MGPSPTYHPPKGEECETSVEHVPHVFPQVGDALCVGTCSRAVGG